EARVRAVDAPGCRAGVPVVDRRVELHARIAALPGRLRDLAEQPARVEGLDRRAVDARGERPFLARERLAHEVVRRADRVVGVLELDRLPGLAVEAHVVARLAERPGLLLFLRLAPYELAHVRMVGVEDHHLRGAARRPARLDRAGDGVGAAHEGDRTRGVAAAGELLLARADLRDVDARSGAAFEDDPFVLEPIED